MFAGRWWLSRAAEVRDEGATMASGHGHGLTAFSPHSSAGLDERAADGRSSPGVGRAVTSASGRHWRPLALSFAVLTGFSVLEIVVGLFTGSLALLSDAAHMVTDVVGVGMALATVLLVNRRTPSARHTFGLYRAEVLAALANAVLLIGVAMFVLVEALRRLADPPLVPGLPVLATASAGLVANLVAFLALRAGSRESLNVRGATLRCSRTRSAR